MMNYEYSKFCSDFLREICPELKASHARELAAAFFGYKSHAALLADKNFPVDYLDIAAVLIPDLCTIHERRECLDGLPADLPGSDDLVYGLVQLLQDQQLFTGDVWERDGLEEFIVEKYLPENLELALLDGELADVIAKTNAFFYEVEFDYAEVQETKSHLMITAFGKYSGTHDPAGGAFCVDTIDLEVTIELRRAAGKIAFEEPVITLKGEVRREDSGSDDVETDSVSVTS
jgi:hypothetical protein